MLYRYGATVNGKLRSVTFTAEDGLTLEQAEFEYIDNTYAAYQKFYAGATYDDYNAERLNPKLERQIPARWEAVS